MPTFDQLPPEGFLPFEEAGFGPFAMLPPGGAEYCRVIDGGDRPAVLREARAKDGESAASVEVAGDQEDGARRGLHPGEAAAHVRGFSEG